MLRAQEISSFTNVVCYWWDLLFVCRKWTIPLALVYPVRVSKTLETRDLSERITLVPLTIHRLVTSSFLPAGKCTGVMWAYQDRLRWRTWTAAVGGCWFPTWGGPTAWAWTEPAGVSTGSMPRPTRWATSTRVAPAGSACCFGGCGTRLDWTCMVTSSTGLTGTRKTSNA